MPALYLGHGAPPLPDDPLWSEQLRGWALDLPKPKAILVVSAHWERAPLTVGATTPVPLVYDFSGFPKRFYEVTYPAPGAPELADKVTNLVRNITPVASDPTRGLDHGAYVPLTIMYPEADIPVLQISMPSENPRTLLEIGKRLAPLREEGVLIQGSGFLTHGFSGMNPRLGTDQDPAQWAVEFDAWAADALARKDVDSLVDYRLRAPGLRWAHPTVDHWVPLFIALGASVEAGADSTTKIDGYWMANSKRSVQFGEARSALTP